MKCYRTAFHYASGMENNRRMVQLLSQCGLSDNVYDKDGQTPLDFQERAVSEELQEVIRINRDRLFGKVAEPNPWTWKVWTRIQSEKDTLKQLISYSNPSPFMPLNANRIRGDSHGHGHSHGHYSHHRSDHHDDFEEDEDENDYKPEQCVIL